MDMNASTSGARSFRYHEIAVGMRPALAYEITPEVRRHFLEGFQDFSPVHVDEDFAKSRGFAGPITHGAVLNGFISHFVGMHFPGRFSLLLSVDLRFSQPCYPGDSIRVEMLVTQKMDAGRIIVLDATLSNVTRDCLAARGRIQVMLKE
jgi:3-hydroxybutyryl-CoA dehydratase